VYSRVNPLRINDLKRQIKFLLYIPPVIRKDNFMNSKNDSGLTELLTRAPHVSIRLPDLHSVLTFQHFNVLTPRRHPQSIYPACVGPPGGSLLFLTCREIHQSPPKSTQVQSSPVKSTNIRMRQNSNVGTHYSLQLRLVLHHAGDRPLIEQARPGNLFIHLPR